ncbi:hypothetical protein GCM10010532_096070 [Dactylosporangium siamense]|uniref:Uncharacterized protein n=1 Tax=Dactylosporangium siamense TaxID=685454 RepID=A0A919UC33_9ACTN|nr:hypothetical protein Dsi01nite_079430 [Dactylosporangium siamense]
MPFDPGQGGAAQPVGGDALRGDPGQVPADAAPQFVVAAAGQGAAVAVPQQRVRRQDRAADGGVLHEAGGEVEADRLPADCAAILPQLQQAAVGVQVLQAQPEGTGAPAGGLGVQAQ